MINELEMIDSLALSENDKSELLLAISDHLDWQFEREHLLLLQEKLNNYVNYILNEEYKDIYQEEIKSFQIIVFVKYQPRRKFVKLLTQFNKMLKKQIPDASIEINYQLVENEDE